MTRHLRAICAQNEHERKDKEEDEEDEDDEHGDEDNETHKATDEDNRTTTQTGRPQIRFKSNKHRFPFLWLAKQEKLTCCQVIRLDAKGRHL